MAFPSAPFPAANPRAGNGSGGSFPGRRQPNPYPLHAHPEGEHQLEKLEFALAVALTRGDQGRSQQLRDQIAALGGNQEEPGT
ncbi:MAG: hypothetical protein ACKN89_07045 [Cyanobium sp.]